jgi:hypothetical protein
VRHERTDAVRPAPRPANLDTARGAERAALLRRLRAEAGTLTAPL